MTQEEKELLLKDLSARLPYEVKVQYNNEIYNVDYISVLYEEVKLDIPDNYTVGISEIKPYLRPMESMTEEETDEFQQLDTECDKMPTFDYVSIEHYRIFDWLNAHHFDYRGLVPKGLAIAVTKDNNPYKE
jgi:hypothetical protein